MTNKEICDEMYKQWKSLNNAINRVSAWHRHCGRVADNDLTYLCNKQIDVEREMIRLFLISGDSSTL